MSGIRLASRATLGLRVPLTVLSLLWGLPAAGQSTAESPPGYVERAKELLSNLDKERTLAEIRDLYNQARAAGDTVPADIFAWVREDLGRSGAWEYQLLSASPREHARLQTQLNTLGRERWECVGVSHTGEEMLVVLKRPMKSYLGHLNVQDVLRALPARN